MFHTRETIIRPNWRTVIKAMAAILLFGVCFVLIMGRGPFGLAGSDGDTGSPAGESWAHDDDEDATTRELQPLVLPFCTVEDMRELIEELNTCQRELTECNEY